MAQAFFAPNKSNTGGAAFLRVNEEDEVFYIKFIKQVSWNETKRSGNFVDGDEIHLKLGMDEAGELIRAAKGKGVFKFFHTSEDSKTMGQFSFYQIKGKNDEDVEVVKREGFGWSITKGEVTIKVGMTFGAAQRMALFLEHGLGLMFDLDIQDEKDAYAKRLAEKQAAETPKEQVQQSAPETPKKKTTSAAPKKAASKAKEEEPVENAGNSDGEDPF